jgi:hypothetical protein
MKLYSNKRKTRFQATSILLHIKNKQISFKSTTSTLHQMWILNGKMPADYPGAFQAVFFKQFPLTFDLD